MDSVARLFTELEMYPKWLIERVVANACVGNRPVPTIDDVKDYYRVPARETEARVIREIVLRMISMGFKRKIIERIVGRKQGYVSAIVNQEKWEAERERQRHEQSNKN